MDAPVVVLGTLAVGALLTVASVLGFFAVLAAWALTRLLVVAGARVVFALLPAP